jgi:hypothetical protein
MDSIFSKNLLAHKMVPDTLADASVKGKIRGRVYQTAENEEV